MFVAAEAPYNDGFHDAASGVQLAKTNTKARIATITIIDMLTAIMTTTLLRRSKRMHVNPIAHFIIVDEMKYRTSQ